jgi:hypothetical protein
MEWINVIILIAEVGVYLYLAFFIIERTRIAAPLYMGLMATLLFFWRRIRGGALATMVPELTEQMNILEKNYNNARKIKAKRRTKK